MPTYVRLRDLIRNIRSQKTMADERAVIQKELAIIRTAFKEEDVEYRTRNVAKVLYIHMLGYPTHFAQLETLKLIASPKFGDKRMGYLGAQMLLDEKSDVHLLLTNSLKVDMNAPNQYVCCLALCTLGNTCSAEMARDLSGEVEKLLKSSNALVRKKAALCACRIIQKVPDLLENYVPLVRQLLNERNHGVLLTGVTLAMEMCNMDGETLDYFRRMVPNLVRMLKTLIMSGHTPDHDVSGVTDPFLQVKIIQLLGILGHGDAEASDQMNDILAQVATNTESAKNVGNAILYECARTIMKINAESGLRVLAINILGRFLLNPDKNIRYVALNTLLKCVNSEMQAVQRHRGTIVDCLKDPDVSIRRRALELVFALMNHSTIRALMREILAFLDVADTEFKAYMCSSIATSAARYAPNKRWHMDTLLKMLSSAGNYITEELVTTVVQMITQTEELHAYVTQRLFVAIQDDIAKQPLVQISAWCIGEYGDLLVGGAVEDEEPIDVDESEVVDILENILTSPLANQVTKEYVLTALVKLSTRFQSGQDRIRAIIDFYTTSIDVELQQRAVEYNSLFDSQNNQLRSQLLERMPVKEPEEPLERYSDDERDEDEGDYRRDRRDRSPSPRGRGRDRSLSPVPRKGAPQQAPSGGMDLLDLLGGDIAPAAPAHAPMAALPAMGGNDLLDLLGGGPSVQPAAAPMAASGPTDMLDLLGGMAGAPQPAPQVGAGGFPPLTIYEKNGIRLVFNFEKSPNAPHVVAMQLVATNANPVPVSNFVFQVAVPKTLKLQVGPASGTDIAPMGQGRVTQVIKVANPQQHPLKLRIKVTGVMNGQPFADQDQVENFPPGL